MNQSTLGSYIRFLRMQNHLTQSQLAEKLNITGKAVSKWERGLSYPDVVLFPKLADVLGVDVNDLLKECITEGQPPRLVQIFEMSRDIRTPLHIILGCADMAANHYYDKDLVLRYLQSIRISGEYLLESVNCISQLINRMQDGPDHKCIEHLDELEKHLKELSAFHKKYFDPYDFSGRRILVVEDMEINREIAREILIQTGAEIEFAVDGQDCLDKIAAFPGGYYDLILMDIVMPNMNGIEATRRIRALEDKSKASIPVIAVTANVQEKDRKAALEAGMNGFTEKPIFVDQLFDKMKYYLQDK